MDEFEVAYRITAVWEASDRSENRAMYVSFHNARESI